MANKLAIIGAGPGGYVAAIRAAQLGAEVTLMERENVGGTCLNWGCIPSKVMKTTAELLERLQSSAHFGVQLKEPARPDMQALMNRKQEVVRAQAEAILKLIRHHKIQYVKGVGKIVAHGRSLVELTGGQTLEVPWDRLILASGSQPLDLPTLPFDGTRVLSSNDVLSLGEIPGSMLIVGAGVIGCEFAFIFSALGSEVTIVEALERALPLPSVDKDCSKVLQREMKKRKIRLMVQRTVEGVEEEGDRILVKLGPSPFMEQAGERVAKPERIHVDKILVCIGRKPSSEDTGIHQVGVECDEKGWVLANERMETNVDGVYAVGDMLGPAKVMLAHVASAEGLVAAENAMGDSRKMGYEVIPSAVYTMPEVADVGLTEAQAGALGYKYRSDVVLFRNLGKPQVMGEIAGQAKIISDAEKGRILGVHMVGPRVTDLIAEGTLAIRLGCALEDLAETIHAHPTLSEVMVETSLKALDRPLHG